MRGGFRRVSLYWCDIQSFCESRSIEKPTSRGTYKIVICGSSEAPMELGCRCWVCRSHTTRACIRTLVVDHHACTECLRGAAVCSATQRDYHDRCNATLAPLLIVGAGLGIFLRAGNESRAGGGVSAAGASTRAKRALWTARREGQTSSPDGKSMQEPEGA